MFARQRERLYSEAVKGQAEATLPSFLQRFAQTIPFVQITWNLGP